MFGYVPSRDLFLRRKHLLNSPQDEIARYLRTGKSDMLHLAWPGDSIIACGCNGKQATRNALIAEVIRRTTHAKIPEQLVDLNVAALAEEKIAPMVRGLFPADEQAVLMEMFSRSIVFLTPDNIASVIMKTSFASTAWDLANLYLLSCGGEPLSKEAPELVGLSEETTCYVSMTYFLSENRLDDFVVHEAAHVFHNCKRAMIGLPTIRGREWLLEIDYRKRELFANACEAYGCIAALGSTPTSRKALLAEIKADWIPPDDRVDVDEYLATLHEAVGARNGWKRILERCGPPPRRRVKPDESIRA
ncbi:hypothetical protein [Acidisphaera sp. S103]|uniref:hypothetical protein n=1 Tax=Acidisphaera sp. S103 TaxID=1747223 RepID=UPI00131BC483|nr:hypothetical protein [Acidisphaera sp. S103]